MSTSFQGTWNYPTPIRFGAGRINELAQACAELGIRRPLVVTDPGLARLPMFAAILGVLEDGGLTVSRFTEVHPNPTEQDVAGGLAAFHAGDCDGVVALGGGSAMDAAKAVALMARHDRPLWDFEDIGDNWKRAQAELIAPIVAVPTTSGTGSEVGRCAVIVDSTEHRKVILFHPRLLPERVICDPALTLGLPPHLTAATGMDALAHCLEALCAPGFHPMAEGIALEGIRLVHAYLPRAVADSSDLEARSAMMVASTMGATAFQKGLGAIHSISHPVGALYNTHHGLTNAVVMPYVLMHNRDAIAEPMERVRRILGFPSGTWQAVLDWVLDLREEIGIPHALSDLGVKEDDVGRIAALALVDPTAATNPVLLDLEGLTRLTRQCVRGELD